MKNPPNDWTEKVAIFSPEFLRESKEMVIFTRVVKSALFGLLFVSAVALEEVGGIWLIDWLEKLVFFSKHCVKKLVILIHVSNEP